MWFLRLKLRRQVLYQQNFSLAQPEPGATLSSARMWRVGPSDTGNVPRETVPLVFGHQTHKVLGQQLLLGIQRDFCGIAGGKSPILGTRSLSPTESEQQE